MGFETPWVTRQFDAADRPYTDPCALRTLPRWPTGLRGMGSVVTALYDDFMMGSQRGSSSSAMSSRNSAATTLSIIAPIGVAAMFALALFAPEDWAAWRMFGLVSVVLWLAWAIWSWPRIDVDETTVTVRNALATWRIPLHEIRDVEGGRKFTLTLTGGKKVTAAAISGDGIAVEAWRRTDAATQGGHFVRSADDARISQGSQSAAASWAKQLRVRVREAPDTARGPVIRHTNWVIVSVSFLVIALFIASITIFR